MLDKDRACCTDYGNRRAHVPDCVTLTPETVGDIAWLPRTCTYRLRHEGQALPSWHYLICDDREAVHGAGESVRGWTVDEAEGQDIEDHLISRPI